MTRVAIIGGGLAGTACAYMFGRAGCNVTIYEAADRLASGASGNVLGLYNPRLSAHMTPQSFYYSEAFWHAISVFEGLKNIDWKRCGSLHLITDEKREKKFRQCADNWDWPEGELQILSVEDASEIAGIPLKYDSLYLPSAGAVSPRKLCAAMARGADVKLNHSVADLNDLGADLVILACGRGVLEFDIAAHLPLNFIRGQVTKVRAHTASLSLKTNLCYGGYMSVPHDGEHVVGATFQRWLDHSDILPEDDVQNLENLSDVAPKIAGGMDVLDHRAAVRVAAKDVFPVVGRLNGDVYVSVAHGSHGIISSIMAARLLVQQALDKGVDCLPADTVEALAPHRFCVKS